MKRWLIPTMAVTAGLTGAAVIGAAPAAGAAETAQVSVVHGIPKTPVNVFVDGKATLQNFAPGKVAGPLELPAGSYEITVFPASDRQGTGTPVISTDAEVDGGNDYSLLAHLDANGEPTLTPYVNDTARVDAGSARLVVRHGAAAPAVDVRADGKVAFADLANPKQAQADLPAGSIEADVVLAGTSTVAIGPASVDLAEGQSTIVYATGSAEDKTLGLVSQRIDGLDSAPGAVQAGEGGLADGAGGVAGWTWVAIAAALALALLGMTGFYRTVRARD